MQVWGAALPPLPRRLVPASVHSPCLCTCGSLGPGSRLRPGPPARPGSPGKGLAPGGSAGSRKGRRGGGWKEGVPAPGLSLWPRLTTPSPQLTAPRPRFESARAGPGRGSDVARAAEREPGSQGRGPRGGRSPGLRAGLGSGTARGLGRWGGACGEERRGRGRRCGGTAAGEPAAPSTAPRRPAGTGRWGAAGGQGSAGDLGLAIRGTVREETALLDMITRAGSGSSGILATR